MTTLIVGCGYLGLRVARLLRERAPQSVVIGTTRSPSRFEEIAEAGAGPILADVHDPESLASLPDFDAVVYCVALGRASRESPATAMGAFLSELERRGWQGRFVHVSTTSVYGQTDGSWVDERLAAEPGTEAGRSALAAENLLREVRPSAVTIRMVGLYGPGRVIGRAGIQRGEAVAGDPDRWLNLLRIEDAARVVVAALEVACPSPLYLACDDRPLLRGEYYAAVAETIGFPPPVFARGGRSEPSRRVCNRLMREDLGVIPDFPDVFAGLRGL